jgi:hypothetical protein
MVRAAAIDSIRWLRARPHEPPSTAIISVPSVRGLVMRLGPAPEDLD